jgi:hypothetical protein
LPGITLEKQQINVRIVDAQAEIRTGHFSNTNQRLYDIRKRSQRHYVPSLYVWSYASTFPYVIMAF